VTGHLAWLGICGDLLTFLGACLLARDAFLRLSDLRRKRTDQEFRRQFPRLNLTDEEWRAAAARVRWALAGFVLLLLGFSCQLLDRLAR
jgi:hypothetical protein